MPLYKQIVIFTDSKRIKRRGNTLQEFCIKVLSCFILNFIGDFYHQFSQVGF